jgi:hypothetical protein
MEKCSRCRSTVILCHWLGPKNRRHNRYAADGSLYCRNHFDEKENRRNVITHLFKSGIDFLSIKQKYIGN